MYRMHILDILLIFIKSAIIPEETFFWLNKFEIKAKALYGFSTLKTIAAMHE